MVNLQHFISQIVNDSHPKIYNCSFADMDFLGEIAVRGRSRISTQLRFKCRMCGLVSQYSLQPREVNLDEKLVIGVLSGGELL